MAQSVSARYIISSFLAAGCAALFGRMRVGLQDRATADAVGLGFKSRWRANAIAQAKQPADLVAHLLWRNRQMPKELQPITHGSRVQVPSLPPFGRVAQLGRAMNRFLQNLVA